MEVESIEIQDVAEPDQVVSGAAGTGHELRIERGVIGKITGKSTVGPGTATHVVIGLGVLYNGKIEPLPVPATDEPDTCLEPSDIQEIPEKLVFSLFDPRDHVRDRIQMKIARRDQRIIKLEDRRRSQ
ncbi:MAG: hypothetical protein PHF57_12765 [Methanoregula sp.]|nr:hypothetical protein [Methanoregula sp.]